LTPLSDGRTPAAERLTAYEKALLQQFNADVLGRVFFGGPVTVAYKRNYVDPRIAVPKSWRDIYHYASDGQCLGWTRYDGSRRGEFNAQGLKVVEKDALGRCIKAQAVRYEPAGPDKGPPSNPWSATLKEVVASDVTEYEYAGDEDRRGKVKEPAGK
jgi:hypothetical protein